MSTHNQESIEENQGTHLHEKHPDDLGGCDCAYHRQRRLEKQKIHLPTEQNTFLITTSSQKTTENQKKEFIYQRQNQQQQQQQQTKPHGKRWSARLTQAIATAAPMLACAVCPACLSAYGKIFAALGIGFTLSEEEHSYFLLAAVLISLVSSSWRTWVTQKLWPLLIAMSGCLLIMAGHWGGHYIGASDFLSICEWIGVLILAVGGIVERQRNQYRNYQKNIQRA